VQAVHTLMDSDSSAVGRMLDKFRQAGTLRLCGVGKHTGVASDVGLATSFYFGKLFTLILRNPPHPTINWQITFFQRKKTDGHFLNILRTVLLKITIPDPPMMRITVAFAEIWTQS
jgi:hypothetical protein